MKEKAAPFILALQAAVVGIALYIAAGGYFQKTPEFYNVLYITADSFRPDHLNCYGYNKRITSPNIDSIAKDGVMFTQMINPSGWTNENLVSIFTSLESPVHKVFCRLRNVDERWVTPLKIFKSYDYVIPRFQPWQRDQNHDGVGFDKFDDSAPLEWMENPAGWIEKNKDKKFFMWFQFLQPHLPYTSTDTYQKEFIKEEMFKNAESRERLKKTVLHTYLIKKGTVEFKPEDKEVIDAAYDAEIKWMDAEFKKIIDMLDKYNLREKTIIVIGADHGEELLDHGFVGHASTSHSGHLYDEIIHTPFIISFPKKLPKSKIITQQVHGIDIMPTIMELMNFDIPQYLRGKSLMPVISGEEKKDRIAFCSTSRAGYPEPDPVNVTDFIRCVRTGDWKLIHYQYKEKADRFEMYNLKNDPKEQKNIIDENSEKAMELRKMLAQWLLDCEQVYPPAPKLNTGAWDTVKGWFGIKVKPIDLTGVPSPPAFIFPAKTGDIIEFEKIAGKVKFEWTGKAGVPYILEYQVGKGDYYMDGTMKIEGNFKDFGAFSKSYWDLFLIERNPFRLRVSIDKEPREFSDWIEVNLK